MAWPPPGVRQRLLDLQGVRDAVRSLDGSDLTLDQCLARYLAVRSAGYLEAVRDDVADMFAASQASPRVVNRIRDGLRGGLGVRPAQLETFVGTFDPLWKAELAALLDSDDGRLRGQLGALVAARKAIAHGDGESVTAGRALAWSEAAEEVANWFLWRFDTTKPNL